jgi:hypothetical protein
MEKRLMSPVNAHSTPDPDIGRKPPHPPPKHPPEPTPPTVDDPPESEFWPPAPVREPGKPAPPASMLRNAAVRAAALAVIGISFNASAQKPTIQPGLWELAITLKSQNGQVEAAMKQVQQQLANMPPAQRKRYEEILAAKGVTLGDKVSTIKACITPEDAQRGEVPQQAGDCTQQVLDRTSTTLKVKFTCATQPPASGEGLVTFQSPTHYTSQAVVNTVVAGQTQQVTVDQVGQWLAADCGAVKPLGR